MATAAPLIRLAEAADIARCFVSVRYLRTARATSGLWYTPCNSQGLSYQLIPFFRGRGWSLLSRRPVLDNDCRSRRTAAFPHAASAGLSTVFRSIRLVIPYPAGGSGDQVRPPWAEKMAIAAGADLFKLSRRWRRARCFSCPRKARPIATLSLGMAAQKSSFR